MRSPFARDESKRAADLRQAGEAAAAPFGELVAEAERIAASVVMGVHGQRRRGTGETFWEYRHPRAEDGAQAVDWRMSAKSSELYVRENEQEAANTVWLWRDGSATMDFGSSRDLPLKKDRAAVCMIAMAALLSRGGERIAALGESARARGGEMGLERTAIRLGTGPGSLASVESAPVSRYGRVVLASDFLDPIETWPAGRCFALLTRWKKTFRSGAGPGSRPQTTVRVCCSAVRRKRARPIARAGRNMVTGWPIWHAPMAGRWSLTGLTGPRLRPCSPCIARWRGTYRCWHSAPSPLPRRWP